MTRYPDILFSWLSGPIALVLVAIGLHFFQRGHNAPGGGFIAGLIVAVAALLVRMSKGRQLLAIPPLVLVPIGLLVATITGLVPLLVGGGFLESAYGHLHWPLIGDFEWATAVAFDAGVFLVVVGVTLSIIDLLAESGSLRRIGPDLPGDDPGPGVGLDQPLTPRGRRGSEGVE